jgi:hypothetical protein
MGTMNRKPGDLPSLVETHATGRRARQRQNMIPDSNTPLDAVQLNASLLALDTEVNEPVQLKLLAWVMGLPSGIDPAMAAKIVMQQQVARPEARISAPLMKLIETVAQYPRERLAQLVIGRRRALLN